MGCDRGGPGPWVGVLAGLLGLWAAPAAAAELGLDEAIRLALERNAEVRLAQGELQVATARRPGAALLLQGNPELSASAGPRLRAGSVSPQVSVSVSQPVEVGGQRGARIDAAAAAIRSAEARLAARTAAVVAEVRQAFGRALAAQAGVTIADEAVRLAKQALAAAEQRHQAGDASRVEVNTARIEVGRTSRAGVAAALRAQVCQAELRLLLGLGPHEDLRLKGTLETLAPPPALEAQARARALDRRADVRAARAEVDEAEAELRLATRDAFPSPRLGASYGTEEGAHIVQGTLAWEVPLFNRNQAAQALARGRVSQSRLSLQALEQRVTQEVELALARVRAARAAADAFGAEVLRAAESSVELANEGYRAGQLDFLQLLLIRRDALDARRGHVEALEELNAAAAQLDQALGVGPGSDPAEPTR